MSEGFPRKRHDLLVAAENPSARQREAAEPSVTAWVSASAGTGKTKVLTDRVLRLLLPQGEGIPGSPPHRILCLTYTKAAASEMALRINRTLSLWATIGNQDLDDALHSLLGRPALLPESEAARRLFARVVDAPGGLKIQTIHSFCQSVLARFPLEADLPPHFIALEEARAQSLLREARDSVLARAHAREDSEEGQALVLLAAEQNEDQFDRLLRGMMAERHQLTSMLKAFESDTKVLAELCRVLGIEPGDTPENLRRAGCRDDAMAVEALRLACRALFDSGMKTDADLAKTLRSFLEAGENDRDFDSVLKILTTKEDGHTLRPKKKLGTNGANALYPGCSDVLQTEAFRLLAVNEQINAALNARLTMALIVLGRAIASEYRTLKERHAALDFDDLIHRTLDLLRRQDMAGWVLYKLDGGLDHLLIDEAQDTNPAQWDIVDALVGEFFAGQGARAQARTLFTVGDEKQSIYSFQGAAPDKFVSRRDEFKTRVKNGGGQWRDVALETSFRSTPTVLDFVDAVFHGADRAQGLGDTPLRHISWKHHDAGRVELWPLFTTPAPDKGDHWEPARGVRSNRKAPAILAGHMAQTIRDWLDQGEFLPSKNRAVRPGDILVLVRRRSAFVTHLIRALKERGVPVGGVDRMVLNDQLAVQDLLAAAQVALLPEDDLTLACLLKSPFTGWSDQDLEDLALGRKPSQGLWDALREAQAGSSTVQWLRRLIQDAASAHPYEFFSSLLHSPCPADPVSGLHAISSRLGDEALDPVTEFLNQALAFEKDNIAALQSFLLWQQQGEQEIKREQEEAGSKVRIMTIHAAKGLQAPIVFLPDTVLDKKGGQGGSAARLLWPDKTMLGVPLWSPRRAADSPLFRDVLTHVEGREMDEYRRLLYVALTRAEDRLYIAGWQGRNPPQPESWYAQLETAFSHFHDCLSLDFHGHPDLVFENGPPVMLRLENAQTRQAFIKGEVKAAEAPFPGMQDFPWAYAVPPAEPSPPRPLVPSRPSGTEPAARSPLSAGDAHRFRRGLVTHRLLQVLPDLPSGAHEQAASLFVGQEAHGLPQYVQGDIVRETLSILRHPDFSPLFGPGSQAEVPITGLLHGQLVSGQIDRLLVTDDAIWIVDYKTNRPPPAIPDDVPDSYRRQMGAYAATLSAIWPGRPVRTFLLWTDGPVLMEIKASG